MKNKKLHFLSADTAEAQKALKNLISLYGQTSIGESDILVVLGGDGTILHTIQNYIQEKKLIFGMNKGSIGFLMNNYHEDNLLDRIKKAQSVTIYPLILNAELKNGKKITAHAFNEVSLFRQSYQAAKIQIQVDEKIRIEELICDGIMLSTPAGSTAYNLSANGPILPIEAPLMALTPISPFRPRRWHGALLSKYRKVRFKVLEQEKRPVNLAADNIELKSISSVSITTDKEKNATLLFDPDHSWDEKIIKEQFQY